jgi:hypothetical protein
MNDAAWLPSAIMQTTGAIIGIYMILYVYAVSKIEEKEGTDKIARFLIERARKGLLVIHCILISLGVITIAINAWWLNSLTANVFKDSHLGLGFWSLMFFLITLLWVCLFSLFLMNDLTKLFAYLREKQ